MKKDLPKPKGVIHPTFTAKERFISLLKSMIWIKRQTIRS